MFTFYASIIIIIITQKISFSISLSPAYTLSLYFALTLSVSWQPQYEHAILSYTTTNTMSMHLFNYIRGKKGHHHKDFGGPGPLTYVSMKSAREDKKLDDEKNLMKGF